MSKRLYADDLDRRDKVQIYADILKVTSRPTNTTRILRLANVQYNTFIEAIKTLCDAGLLDRLSLGSKSRKHRKFAYQVTEMGKRWCSSLDKIYKDLEK